MDKSGSWQHLVCAVIFVCSSSLSFAEEDLFDLDLQALANIKVTSASRVEQTIQKAPAVISVITRQDIDRYGANNLFDVLQYFPGFLSLTNSSTGKSGLAIRGDSTITSERMLTLIDGKPYRSMTSGGYVTDMLYRSFPLTGVERIELIRGPGSAMYGTTAVSSVINIVTRKATSESSGQVNAQAGSQDSNQESLFWGNTGEDTSGWRVNTAANVHRSDGYNIDGKNKGAPFEFNDYSKEESLFLNIENEHFYIKGLAMYMNRNTPALLQGVEEDINTENQQYFDTGYNANINEQWRYDAHYSHLIVDDNNLSIKNTEDLIEVNLFGDVMEHTQLQTGLSLNQSQAESVNKNVSGLENYPEFRGGVYAQLSHQIDEQWSTYTGVQWNKAEGDSGQASPRLGLIYAYDEVSGVKLLYNEAFRLPTAAEANLQISVTGLGVVFMENPNLDAETVKTVDLQWYHYGKNAEYTFTLFDSHYQNRISNKDVVITAVPFPVVVTPGQFVQNEDLHTYGTEWESKFNLTPQDNVVSNLVWQRNTSGGNSDTTLVPRWIASLGYSHTFNNDVIWSIYNQHASAFSDSSITTISPNPDPESYDLLSSKLTIPIAIPLANQSVELFVYGTNLLDEEVWQPEYVGSVNSTPIEDGRAIYVGVQVNW